MVKATISGVECKVCNFRYDDRGRLWVDVKCEYYARPLPLYAGFIEVVDDENKIDNHA